jgi:hypothetical protein
MFAWEDEMVEMTELSLQLDLEQVAKDVLRRSRGRVLPTGTPLGKHLRHVVQNVADLGKRISLGPYPLKMAQAAAWWHEAGRLGADFEEVANSTNEQVARFVALLTPDLRSPLIMRRTNYIKNLSCSPLIVQLIVWADLQENIQDWLAFLDRHPDRLESARPHLQTIRAIWLTLPPTGPWGAELWVKVKDDWEKLAPYLKKPEVTFLRKTKNAKSTAKR